MTTLPHLDDHGRLTPVTMFLTVHHGLRRDGGRYPAALRSAAGEPDRLAAIARHWEQYVAILVHHHHQEDTLLFPQVVEQDPSLAAAVAGLDADHVALDDLLVEANAAFAGLARADGADTEAVTAGAALVDQVADLLGRHLDAEEEQLLPLMAGGTLDAPKPSGPGAGDGGSPFGESDPAFVVPWMADGMGTEIVVALLTNLPREVQESFPAWVIAYRSAFADLAAMPVR